MTPTRNLTENANPRNTIVVLTAAYPFDRAAETFFVPELRILAQRFDRVIILPSHAGDYVRPLPAGVLCDTRLTSITNRNAVAELGRSLRRSALEYGRSIVEEQYPIEYITHPKPYISALGRNLLKYRLLKDFIAAERLHEALFYDYWLENTTLALSWLRRERLIRRAVARAHGFDVYEDRSHGRKIPFQAEKLRSLDRVFTVSSHGFEHLAAEYPSARPKLMVSRLGAEFSPPRGVIESGTTPLIVSCASLKSFKRVQLIPSVLAALERPVRWIHFGDGPDREKVERAAAQLPSWVDWKLVGQVDHADLIEFYRTNTVALFVSLSVNEGLPASMMEAISCGIPIVAVNVGGVSEIVTERTGRLIGVGDPPASIAREVRRLVDGAGPTQAEIREFFSANFDARKNFEEFARILHTI